MSNSFSKILTGALITGLLAGSVAMAEEAATTSKEKATIHKTTVEKTSTEGKNSCKVKNTCKGKKAKKDKSACNSPNGCKGAAKKTETAPTP